VRLVVHQAKDLDSTKSISGSLNPFIKIHLGDEASPTHTSSRVKHTVNPVWESAAEFLCVDRESSVITIQVLDDKLLGYITVPLESLLQAQGQSGKDWWPLSGCSTGSRIRLSTEWKPLDMTGSLYGKDQHVPAIGVVRLLLQKATDVK
jgi:Ca2+-dependent lipid-binding protein